MSKFKSTNIVCLKRTSVITDVNKNKYNLIKLIAI